MKKLISMILAFSIVASVLFCIPVSAEVGKVDGNYSPEGTPITSAEEFAAMSAEGKYYLANDITVSATWNAGAAVSSTYANNVAFTGTFDGNGHTVTTTVALFANLEGTVKNLTVEGEIQSKTTHNANVAMWSSGTLRFENVHTKANILGGDVSAPLLGYGAPGTYVTVKNCINDADVTSKNHAGGFVGFVKDNYAYFENCENNGDIKSTAKYTAGMIAVAGDGTTATIANSSAFIFKNCINRGDLYGATGRTAGIVSYLRGYGLLENCENYGTVENAASIAAGIFGTTDIEKDYTSSLLISRCRNYGTVKSPLQAAGIAGNLGQQNPASGYKYMIFACENNGDIYVTAPASGSGAIYACGLAAYALGGSNSPNGVLNSINTGNIYLVNNSTRNAYVCAFVGYVNSASFSLKNNINTGNISINGHVYTTSLTMYNKTSPSASAVSNNYSIAVDGINTMPVKGNPTATPRVPPETNITDETMIRIVTKEQVESGELVHTLNSEVKDEIFFQKLGTDKSPVTTPDGNNCVEKQGESYVNVNKMPNILPSADYPKFDIPEDDVELPDIEDIPIPDLPLTEVTLPERGNVGKVDSSYTASGNAITSAAEFAAMTANGNYYLANDITLSSSYSLTFTGSFDGNGHKITTSAPLFTNLAGNVKNLSVEGEITNSADLSAVALYCSGKTNIENVYTNVKLSSGKNCGALIARSSSSAAITVKNCRNDGDIDGNGTLGGIIGYAEGNKLTVENTVNCGNITLNVGGTDAYGAAGIIGRFGNASATATASQCTLKNCENYGDVSSSVSGDIAGILATLNGMATVDACVNYGDIVSRISLAAGIFGSSTSTASASAIYVKNCVNNGLIGGVRASGIASRVGRAAPATNHIYSVKNCVNNGDIYGITFTGVDEATYVGGIVGYGYGGTTYNELMNCVNTGDINVDASKTTKDVYVAGILAYVNGGRFMVRHNINTGSITLTGTATVVALTLYNKTTSPYESYNNYSVASGNIPVVKIATFGSVGERLAAVVTLEQLASGEIAYRMNEIELFVDNANKNTVAYQNIGEDALPVFDSTHKLVYQKDDGTYTNEKVENNEGNENEETTVPADTTTAPEGDVTTNTPNGDTTELPENNTTATPDNTTATPDTTTAAKPQKSCGGFAFAAQIVTILGAAITVVVFKKKN